MSGCTGLWPTDDSGLELLFDAGIQMATGTGFSGLLSAQMPAIDPDRAASAAALGLPPETALHPTDNDLLLERCVRRQMPIIDMCVVRTAGFYMESLSYHHSYQPSVDRMVRRMQIFTQQTADYPSFWGVNYSWFPQLGGYSEGGVPTDAAHGRPECRAGRRAGPRWFCRRHARRDPLVSREPVLGQLRRAQKARAIQEKAVAYWRARLDYGFGRHNKLYNDAVREVRPGTICTLFENAGHDAGKRPRALFNDMAASCFESYTDGGEWPMSAPFTTDWEKGNNPGKPVWLTVDWGTSSEGAVRSLFHAFGRGLDGGGTPMQAEKGRAELTRLGAAQKFLSQYGAIATRATPDNRFAILSTDAEQVLSANGPAQYNVHALYCHLTRFGLRRWSLPTRTWRSREFRRTSRSCSSSGSVNRSRPRRPTPSPPSKSAAAAWPSPPTRPSRWTAPRRSQAR